VVYLISAYPKNEKENLSADDKKAMRKLTKVLKDEN